MVTSEDWMLNLVTSTWGDVHVYVDYVKLLDMPKWLTIAEGILPINLLTLFSSNKTYFINLSAPGQVFFQGLIQYLL